MVSPEFLKPHDLRHGVAMEVLSQRNNLEEVRALLGHTRLETTQVYTTIRPPQLKQAVAFYEDHARALLTERPANAERVSGTFECS
jgi:site-specific recombinase XerD